VPLLAADPSAAEPTLPQALQEANDKLAANKLAEAEAEFHRAEALAGGPCGECLLGLAMVRAAEKKWGKTADLIESALPLLSAPRSRALAYNQLGVAYVNETGGSRRLAKAEEALRNSVATGGPWGQVARRNLAQVLFLEKRWADAVAVAREALEKAGSDEKAAQGARIVLCQTRSHLPDELKDVGDPASSDQARKVEGEVMRPVKIAGSPPWYTEEARRARVKGVVIVESIIDREGCVRKATLAKGLPKGLSDTVLRVLSSSWVFSPATLEGKPVAVYYTLSVNFEVKNSVKPPTL
jgi:tetratricopeptide (TPR) repeat protein